MNSAWQWFFRWGATLGLALALGGCAASFSAQVTRYQQWPGQVVGARYWIAPEGSQQNNLQFQMYADAVRAALGPTGLVEGQSADQARFIVRMDYDSTYRRVWRQQMVEPYFYSGFYGPHFGYYPYWGGMGFGPMIESVPQDAYELRLTVRIDDQAQQGREVYRATAVATSGQDNLGPAMPYLARAVFDQFPGGNGQVIRVRYAVQ